tara:strand:+ start:687 stop:1046 length:360 start_codon:yes stop_codon:yes gene_type:complete
MNIDYTMKLRSISVIDQQDTFTNVIKRVEWVVSFFDTATPHVISDGTVETYLNTDAISADTFTPYDNLTHTAILQWALDAEGGTAFLDQLLEGGHAAHLEKSIADASLTDKDVDLLLEA